MINDQQDRDRAKQIIFEIIREAGGELTNKTNLYKVFWKAHLEFAKKNAGYLSMWPIVKMPNGPGIDNFDSLLGELIADGTLTVDGVQKGDFQAFRFRVADNTAESSLTPEEQEAIQAAVESVRGKTAAKASSDSHLQSRSWREANEGDELNIYIDLLSDAEYQQKRAKMEKLAEAFD